MIIMRAKVGAKEHQEAPSSLKEFHYLRAMRGEAGVIVPLLDNPQQL